MAREMRIDDALIRLNEGKFSFQMSECIADHIAAQSRQIDALTALNDRHRFDIMQRDLHIHLLEKEVDNLKKLLSVALLPQDLVSQAIETAAGAREKLRAFDGTSARILLVEMKTKLPALDDRFSLGIAQLLKVLQPRVEEAVKSFERITTIIFSKIKAAA